ncbi:MAG: DUF615 domain-containing protein [Gammaproteobacteria bacterium]|nr:DUF615 domain-containing protein [Gammaproteobacteria bacterium]
MSTEIEDDDNWISKTQVKRQCDALQQLGEELIELKDSELEKISLPDVLLNAIHEARKIRKHGAQKRQRQYIGKLMRDADGDQIKHQLDQIRHKDDLNNALFKRIENWRDRILEEGDRAINELVDEYPDADRQYLRQLYRNSQKEKQQNKPPTSFRLIFKYIRELAEK